MTTTTLDTCIATGCTDTADEDGDYCINHEDLYNDDNTCTFVYNVGSYSNPPEPCDNDAVPGTDRCSAHSEAGLWEDDEDTHDYYD